jgi:hypothetical protein
MGVQEEINIAVAQVATDYGAAYVKDIKTALSQKDKIASGALYNSINSNVEILPEGVHLSLIYLSYLDWIDMGRRPGTMPPVSAILDWIKARQFPITQRNRRNILGHFSRGFKRLQGRDVRGRFTTVEQQQQKMAWAIAVGIKKNGIKPVPILKDAADKLYGPMQADATAAAVQAARLHMDKELEKAITQAGLLITTTY